MVNEKIGVKDHTWGSNENYLTHDWKYWVI